MAQPQPTYQPLSKKRIGSVILTIVVVVVALVGFFIIPKSGKIVVDLSSLHLLSSVKYRVLLDGQPKVSGTLAPGQDVEHTFGLSWFLDSCQMHQVFAESSGPRSPAANISSSVNLCNGEVKEVYLQV